MKKILTVCLAIILFACGDKTSKSQKVEAKDLDVQFEVFKTDFIESLWKVNPLWASYEGYHNYDSLLPIPNKQGRKQKLDFAQEMQKGLKQFNEKELSDINRIDWYMMRDYLASIDFYENEFKSYEWNPSNYNLGGAFFQVINYRKQSLVERLSNLKLKLEKVPSYYEAAKENLNNPSRVHTELAIEQLDGSKSIFEKTLMDSLAIADVDSSYKNGFKKLVNQAVVAIDSYVVYLKEDVIVNLPEDDDSYRIGKELFEKKFEYQIQSSYTAEEIFQAAVEAKSDLHDQMYRLSDLLWERYFANQERPGSIFDQIQLVVNEVSKQHVHRDSFITAIRKQIPELQAFVQERDLLTLDSTKPLVVRETPEYMRGVAGASISAPGPYDKDAETYYNVTPLDHYTKEEAESYLREYNDFVLQILNIHEAIPGHYAQLVYSNQSPSMIKSILGNGAMVEGWAVYTEKMMLEAGYGGDQLEMGLMYYKWNLRTVCNTILDYGVHANNISEEDAMRLLTKEAFQQKSEAIGKWRRARLSQVQLCSYFTGYYEIMQLRDEMRELLGEQFDLKAFHEEFLSYGSAPVKYIRMLMLEKVRQNQEEADV
jgi:uncharacterized protein (DUF885 family)